MSATPIRPALLQLNPANIPPELRAIPAWVGWRLVFEKGRWTKKPIDIKTGELAKTDNPLTWCDFETALRDYQRCGCDGIGLCRTADHVFIDCDGVFDQEGTLLPFTWEEKIHSAISGRAYMEKSVSGTGLHGIVRGTLPPGRRQYDDPNREHTGYAFYDNSRFFTFSGNVLPDSGDIRDLTLELANLHRELFPPAASANGARNDGPRRATASFSLDDSELLERARRATNGLKFSRLWEGDWSTYPSQSEGDSALCCMLAFWTRRDVTRIDSLFRQSGLMRDKWLRDDYRQTTIANACQRVTEVWEPQRRDEGRAMADETKAQPASSSIKINEIAESITARHRFAKDAGGRLHIFRGGTYHADGATIVRQQVKQILGRLKMASQWSSHKSEEVVKYIEVDVPLLWESPRPDVVNVLNGLLDVNTLTLSPHSSDFLSPVQVPVKFDPAARCPAWDKFIAEVFPDDSEAIAWEILAWLMTPDTSIQKAILLLGDGANGKSTYLRGVVAFIGKHNTAAVSLHKLENDRFSAARLIGRLANICPDLPSTDLASTSVFKAITGGDPLMAEYKFKDSFEFIPYSRLVFSANHPPKSLDASPAFFRRWLVVPLERTFADGTPSTIPSNKLDAMLSDPTELSGVLNKALLALETIRKNRGFTESDSISRAIDEFRQATDPLAVWLDRKTILQPDAVTPKDQLHREYCRNCNDAGRPTISKTAFGRAIKKLRPTVTDYQRTVNGALAWCYIGIGLLANDEE